MSGIYSEEYKKHPDYRFIEERLKLVLKSLTETEEVTQREYKRYSLNGKALATIEKLDENRINEERIVKNEKSMRRLTLVLVLVLVLVGVLQLIYNYFDNT